MKSYTGFLSDFSLAQLIYQEAADSNAILTKIFAAVQEATVDAANFMYASEDEERQLLTDFDFNEEYAYSIILPSGLLLNVKRVVDHFQDVDDSETTFTIGNYTKKLLHVAREATPSGYRLRYFDACDQVGTLISLTQLKELTSDSELKANLESFYPKGFSLSSLVSDIKSKVGQSEFMMSTCTTFLTNPSASLGEVVSQLQAYSNNAVTYFRNAGQFIASMLASGSGLMGAIYALRETYVDKANDSGSDDYLANWSSSSHKIQDSPIAVMENIAATVASLIGSTLLVAGGVVGKIIGAAFLGIGLVAKALGSITGTSPTVKLDAVDSKYADPIYAGTNVYISSARITQYLEKHQAMTIFTPYWTVFLWNAVRHDGDDPYWTANMRVYLRAAEMCGNDAAATSYGASVYTKVWINSFSGVSLKYRHVLCNYKMNGWAGQVKFYYCETDQPLPDDGSETVSVSGLTLTELNRADYSAYGQMFDSNCYLYDVSAENYDHPDKMAGLASATGEMLQQTTVGLRRSLRYMLLNMLKSGPNVCPWPSGESTQSPDNITRWLAWTFSSPGVPGGASGSNFTWADFQSVIFDESNSSSLRYFIEHSMQLPNQWFIGRTDTMINQGMGCFVPGIDRRYVESFALCPPSVSLQAVIAAALIVVAVVAAVAVTSAIVKTVVKRKIAVHAALKRSQFQAEWDAALQAGNAQSMERLLKRSAKYDFLYGLFGIGSYDLANGWVNDPSAGLLSRVSSNGTALTGIATDVGNVATDISGVTGDVESLKTSLSRLRKLTTGEN